MVLWFDVQELPKAQPAVVLVKHEIINFGRHPASLKI